jgi:hypothetical protein
VRVYCKNANLPWRITTVNILTIERKAIDSVKSVIRLDNLLQIEALSNLLRVEVTNNDCFIKNARCATRIHSKVSETFSDRKFI